MFPIHDVNPGSARLTMRSSDAQYAIRAWDVGSDSGLPGARLLGLSLSVVRHPFAAGQTISEFTSIRYLLPNGRFLAADAGAAEAIVNLTNRVFSRLDDAGQLTAEMTNVSPKIVWFFSMMLGVPLVETTREQLRRLDDSEGQALPYLEDLEQAAVACRNAFWLR